MGMDIVATKDIAENEEIFLNYGEEWENAFTKHLNEWQQPLDASTYIDANKMNQNDPTSVLRTLSEQRDNPYPSNIQTGCYYKHEEDKETSLYENTVELDIHYDNQVSWLPKNNVLPCFIIPISSITLTPCLSYRCEKCTKRTDSIYCKSVYNEYVCEECL